MAGIGHIGLLAILSLLAWRLPVMGGEAAPHPCHLAIVAGPGLWRDGALLTKLFAQEAGVEVLERDKSLSRRIKAKLVTHSTSWRT